MKPDWTTGAALTVMIVASCGLRPGIAFAQAPVHDQAATTTSSPSADDAAADAGGKAWTGFATLGYQLDPHWRLELQGGYHDSNPPADPAIDPVGGEHALSRALGAAGSCADLWAAPSCAQPDGSGQIYTYSGKLIFDFAPHSRWFDPFIGAGADFNPNAAPQIQILEFAPDTAPFAYQALAGVAFRPIGRLHIDLTYRWTAASGPAARGLSLQGLATRYQDQTVAIGLRYLFAAPPSPPAPLVYAPAASLAQAGK